MKVIIIILCGFIICISGLSVQLRHSRNEVNSETIENTIRTSNINDTLSTKIIGKEFIYFTKGHHGHIWSLAINNVDKYILIAGNTRIGSIRIDTISSDNSILSWGIDSLQYFFGKMNSVYCEFYWPFYERLVLYSDNAKLMFDSENAISYSGPDSVYFNEKLNRLKYFMYWSALDIEVQKKLPMPK